MDLFIIIKIITTLLFVCGLICLVGFLLKRYGSIVNLPTSKRLITIKDNLYINDRARIMLIKREHVEHLILLSRDGNLIIESNIVSKDKKANEN